jgi:hypothetical protein
MNVKRLQAMLDVATIANQVHDVEDEDRGHEVDHWCSPPWGLGEQHHSTGGAWSRAWKRQP